MFAKTVSVKPKANKVYAHCAAVYRAFEEDQRYKILVEQGGTRSGKTYNILIWIIFGYCLQNTGKRVSIVRKTLPALKGSAMQDFFEILENYNLYNAKFHNKTEKTYQLNGNVVEFFSIDDQQKVRGKKRDLLFCNEVNELLYQDFFQLSIRTNEIMIMDFNPDEEYHWLFEKVIPRKDAAFFQTSYKDNPFLPSSLVKEIELLKDTDDTLWQVFGLGNKAQNKALIFPNVQDIDDVPEDAKLVGRGLDFGYSPDPTALIAVYRRGNDLILDEEVYQHELTPKALDDLLKEAGIGRGDDIRHDRGQEMTVAELKKKGWKFVKAKKGPNSIKYGINKMKEFRIFVTSRSKNLRKEFKLYKYKQDNGGNILSEPIDTWNHGIDAVRYAIEPITTKRSKARASVL